MVEELIERIEVLEYKLDKLLEANAVQARFNKLIVEADAELRVDLKKELEALGANMKKYAQLFYGRADKGKK